MDKAAPKPVSSGWCPRWTKDSEPLVDLGPAQVKFFDGVIVGPCEAAVAIVSPLSRNCKVRRGDGIWAMMNGVLMGVGDVFEVFL